MKNKLFKIITTSLTIVTLGGVFVPSAIYANEVLQPETVVSLPSDINRDQLTTEIISDIEKEGLPEVLNERPKRQKRGAAGLMATLIAKYGVRYVKTQLPKIIYKHIGKYVGNKIGEAAFVRIFGNIVDWGTGAAIEQALAQALQAAGIDAGTANTVATVTVTVASWLI
ncbi:MULTISPECIES: hypothetical protein [Streptococcus]|uniref:Uncharacterized protein n=11 Tax=Streptococcus TaxID=1301 RepID=A0AB74H805_STRAG|nr:MULTISPECIES: hypothetical protein [Streptococcus]HER2924670.1 hypothetical protein [Streptococcus pyogenes]MCC9675360.1 hypothetical protein [Streptococcus agalactiae]MCC9714697.1 hypothetical protein [Streptococcus agalactiae]MCC9745407.1 hypothetical protein [Streptococcus agalactiae]MCC9747921.1 hypothetical protein [Streptococcus agalactiae]